MAQIDLSKSLVGELYPLTVNAQKLGSLGFFYPEPGDKSSIQFKEADGTPFSYPCTTGSNPTRDFKWRITPILNNKVLISCTHPLTGRNQLAHCATNRDRFTIIIEERNIPASEEAVKIENQFEVEYIAGSPLFFSFKSANQRYFTAGEVANISIHGRKYYEVESAFDENQKNSDQKNYCSWFLQVDDVKTGANAFAGFKNIKPFDQLTQKFGVQINDSYLSRLTAI